MRIGEHTSPRQADVFHAGRKSHVSETRLAAWIVPAEGDDPRRVMAKVAIWLHWLASLLALSLLAVPPTDSSLIVRISGLAIASVAFTIVIQRIKWESLPQSAFLIVSACDIVLIGLGIAFSGGAESRYQLLLALVVVFGAYFFTVVEAAAVTAAAILALCAPLFYASPPSWALPLDLGISGALVLVAAVVKQAVFRIQRETKLRDDAENALGVLFQEEVERRRALQQKSRQLESVLEVGNAFRLQLGLDSLLETIVRSAAETLGFRAVVARLFDAETGAAVCGAVYGLGRETATAPTPKAVIQSLMVPQFQVGRSFLVEVNDEFLENPEVRPHVHMLSGDLPTGRGYWTKRHTLIVPLETGERGLIGILSIDEPLDRRLPSLETIQVLEIFANMAAAAIENARLLEEAGEAQALREIDRMKSDFLASISHDLRTPLTVIKGSVDLLQSSGETFDPAHQRLIAGISRNTQRLIGMVEQLLEMIQLQEGRITLNLRLVDFAHIVAETVESLSMTAGARRQEIAFTRPSDQVMIMVDPARIQQVVANLVVNASKYGPEGTQIRVTVTADQHFVEVVVHDQGGQISPEEQHRIFDKFYRVNTETSREGAGLGLAICKSLVEMHGGTISVSSGRTKGTDFVVRIPFEPTQ
jgi:signal transduction histidine kinase